MNGLKIAAFAWLTISQCLFGATIAPADDPRRIQTAAISLVPEPLDLEGNAQRLEAAFRQAASGGAKLAVAPEGALDGYIVNHIIRGEIDSARMLDVALPIDHPIIRRFQSLARELRLCIVFGFAERIGDDVYNTAVFIDDQGTLRGKYHKMQFAEGYHPDWWFNRLGTQSRAFDTPFGRCGILICNDRWNPSLARIPKLDGAQFLVIPSYGSTSPEQDSAVLARARETGLPIVEANVGVTLIVSGGEVRAVDRAKVAITFGEIELAAATERRELERDQLEQQFLEWREAEMPARYARQKERIKSTKPAQPPAPGEPAGELPAAETVDRWLATTILSDQQAAAMLPQFLEQHGQPLPLPASRDDWLRDRDALRREILRKLGFDDLLPASWDLQLTHHGTIERDGYRIEKISYETYPGKRIAALLYVPEGTSGRVPGIVSISGHTPQSKAAEYVQQRNVNLVARGCVVLSYDYFGYGESKTGDDPHRPRGGNGHDLKSFSFSRRNATTLEVLDAIRAIDVLAARPEVDPTRIGFTGESGGSNSTYWVSAIDPRVKLAVPVCSVTTFDYWIRTDVNWDWHQRPPGVRRHADIGTLLALHAPNPLLIISSRRGTDDHEFPLDEAEKSHQWARHVYRLLDAEPAIDHYESSTGHGYQEDKQQRLYEAVERWLQPPRPLGTRVLDARIETADDLRCGLPPDNLTCRDVYQQWLTGLPRFDPNVPADQQRVWLRDTLGWPGKLPPVDSKLVKEEEQGEWTVSFRTLTTEPGVPLPVCHIRRRARSDSTALLPGGTRDDVLRALEAGHDVVVLAPRGTGTMAMPKNFANWCWFAGRPIAGMHALDIAQCAAFCRSELGAKSVIAIAKNDFGFATLLAGAVESELFHAGDIALEVNTFQDILAERGDGALAEVPRLFDRLDIPQLIDLWRKGQLAVQIERR